MNRPIGKPKSAGVRKLFEGGVMTTLVLCGLFSLLTTVVIIITLGTDTFRFFTHTQAVTNATALRGTFGTEGGKPIFRLIPPESGDRVQFIPVDRFRVGQSIPGVLQTVITKSPELRLKPRIADPNAPREVREARDIVLPVTSFTVDTLTLAKPVPPGVDLSRFRVDLYHAPVRVSDFLFGGTWNPKLGSVQQFGVWPLIAGTLTITVIAMLVAGPLGLITAIWLSEYAPKPARDILKPILEVLAGVPTVVLGFFALTVITPALQFAFVQHPVLDAQGKPVMTAQLTPQGEPVLDEQGQPVMRVVTRSWNPLGIGSYNVLAAGIAVGILTLPIITSLTEDALRAVPRALREGSYGLGATRFETSVRVVTPAALSGIIAAYLLAIARCVGETMIVALAAGQQPIQLAGLSGQTLEALDPRQGMLPMTGYLVLVIKGDISHFGIDYFSLYAVAAMLFLMTFILTIVGHIIRVKFQQQYE